mmetsp:Transcript_43339/g.99881  ORF Transcript_43339/g.99881 Transcript_43339/m.99881 type:complete len:427 (+) Transcript_43339:61-1341(+)
MRGRALVVIGALASVWWFGALSFAAPAQLQQTESTLTLRGARALAGFAPDARELEFSSRKAGSAVERPKLGSKRKAFVTAGVAAFAAFALHTADVTTKALWGLPLWAGPSAGVCVMFAVAAVTAAEDGQLRDIFGITKFALQVAMGVTGSCAFAVWTCTMLPSVAARRGIAVGLAALWMILNPYSAVFPPSAGYCALYIDQLISNGPMSKLSYTFSVFPCGLGVMVVLLSTRVAAAFGVKPVRMVSDWVRRWRGSRKSPLASKQLTSVSGPLAVEQKVVWQGHTGTIRHIGAVDFAAGDWVGLELDQPNGLHDGTVLGKSYFNCAPKHGIFCQPTDLMVEVKPAAVSPAGAVAAGVGERVMWKGEPGTVRYFGKVGFSAGEWVGVQLDKPIGMHNGTVFDVTYFDCPPKTGIMCSPSEIGLSMASA